MFAAVQSATIVGARGHPVTVEVHVGKGLPGFLVLGLPDESCREARDRVRAAVVTSGFAWPEKKITINLAPALFRKTGSGLDLAMAVGVLVASEQLAPGAVTGMAVAGELGLDGTVRKVPGVAPMVGVLPDLDWVVPTSSCAEATVVARSTVRPASTLREVADALAGVKPWPTVGDVVLDDPADEVDDLADVRGQPLARLALEVAAAGGHHLLFVGPPGSGKTMLARRLPGLLPDLDDDLALQTTMIHSAAGMAIPSSGLVRRPPFRSPHHTSSPGSLVGGGSYSLRPGEASLANGGVLFLDEMGQFNPRVLDALREALEEGRIMVGRVQGERVPVPAGFQLVAATNPCPCGGGGAPGACECDERSRTRYIGRLSGPLLDRFDLRVVVTRPAVGELLDGERGESTAAVAERVCQSRAVALSRSGVLNAALGESALAETSALTTDASDRLRDEMERGRLTARGYVRVRRVARTIADLAGWAEPTIDVAHVETALALRASVGHSSVSQAA